MTCGVFVVLVLASYRVARLVTTDTLTANWRDRLVDRFPPHVEPMRDPTGAPIANSAVQIPSIVVKLVNCTWCVSIWTTLAAALVLHATGYSNSWTLTAFDWLAGATVAGFLSRLEA